MGRVIGSAVTGYVVTFAMVFVLMTLAWFTVGADGAFLPGVWDVTPLWLALLLAGALAAAIAGGYVTATMTSDPRAPRILIGIIVVLGIVFALPVLMSDATTARLPRSDTLAMFDAMTNGKQPAWVAVLNPVLGVIGVLVGARIRAGRPN